MKFCVCIYFSFTVIDSSGSPEPGFILGHNYWLGSIKGCEAVRQPHWITISDRLKPYRHMYDNLHKAKAPIDIDYRVVHAAHNSPWQIQVELLLTSQKILHVGLCMPSSCSNNEIMNVTQEYFDRSMLQAQRFFEHQPQVIQVKDIKVTTNFLEKLSVRIVG